MMKLNQALEIVTFSVTTEVRVKKYIYIPEGQKWAVQSLP